MICYDVYVLHGLQFIYRRCLCYVAHCFTQSMHWGSMCFPLVHGYIVYIYISFLYVRVRVFSASEDVSSGNGLIKCSRVNISFPCDCSPATFERHAQPFACDQPMLDRQVWCKNLEALGGCAASFLGPFLFETVSPFFPFFVSATFSLVTRCLHPHPPRRNAMRPGGTFQT